MKYLLLWLILFPGYCFAGAPDIYFKKIDVEQGLSHRKVNCILQDRRGFLWFGTEDGLNRFDGRYLTVFRYDRANQSSVAGNIISDIYEDSDGVLWIASQDGGMTKYDFRLSSVKQFKQFRYSGRDPHGIPENGINKIVEDRFGNLWLATNSNFVVRFNKKTERFDIPVKKGTRCFYTLAIGANDTLFAGRAGGGLLKINMRNLRYSEDPKYSDLYARLPHTTITALFRDKNDALWMGTWDKAVYRIDRDNRSETVIGPEFHQAGIPPDDYISFAQGADNSIWMAGKTTGLILYDRDQRQFYSYRHDDFKQGSLSDDHVNVVYRDRAGIIWVGTNNGVNMYDPLFSPFVKHKLPKATSDIQIYDFYKHPDGRLLIGTSEGIYINRGHGLSILHLPVTYRGQKLAVSKFFRDIDGQFYIGTDYTLFKYSLSRNEAVPLKNTDADPVMKKLINSRIVSIIRDTIDRHPVLLVSPYGHFLTYYDLTDQKWISRSDSVKAILHRYNLKDNLIRKLVRYNKEGLLLATFKSGIGIWQSQDKPIRYLSNNTWNKNSLSSNNVFDIEEDYGGNLWVSTYGGGLNYYSRVKKRFYHITGSSNLTEGLKLDSNDNVWMICNGHVHKYDPGARIYSCYDIPELKFTGGLTGYLFKDQSGDLYASGINYYIAFNPKSIKRIKHDPDIYFTDFRIFNHSYNEKLYNGKLELSHDQNQITLEFSAPEYSGDNLRYTYMLEGFDHDWIPAGKSNIAQYANLKGGSYLFKVRATNWQGTFTEKYALLAFTVTPPFWLKAWFFAGMAVVIVGIAFLIYRYRMNNLLQKQAIRNGIAQDLHDQIGSTLSSISVYSEVAKKYFEQKETDRLNDVLDTISYTANEMVSEMGDIVWAINPKHDNIESVVNRIKRYAQPVCNAKNINFVLRYERTLAAGNISMQDRKNLFLVIKEAINNAVKHSECKNLIVSLVGNNELAEVIIRDDGIGFKANPHPSTAEQGNGITNIRNRVEELKAVFEFKSEVGWGVYLRIAFK